MLFTCSETPPTPAPPEEATAPTLEKTTQPPATSITQTTATSGGNITADGGLPITARGVVWHTATAPTLDNNKTEDGTGKGTFISKITDLTASTKYFVRSYATNKKGTAYGSEVMFTTKEAPVSVVVPTLEATTEVSDFTATTATSGGNITADGGDAIIARGVVWHTATAPTTDNNKTTETGTTGVFTSKIERLTASTKYFVRAYATNSVGTAYGAEVEFTTEASIPMLTTTAITDPSFTSATSGGDISHNGGVPVMARGIVYGTSSMPDLDNAAATILADSGMGIGTFTSSLTGLIGNTTYYLRAYATNSVGTGYGSEIELTTKAPFEVATNRVTIQAKAGVVAGTKGVVNGVTYTLVDEMTLRMMANIEATANEELSKVVTTGIDDMSKLFDSKISFNGDISTWDVSSVTSMTSMFLSARAFDQPIGNWNVSSVTDMTRMFLDVRVFNRNISTWDVSSVMSMESMFFSADAFDQDLSGWNVSKVTSCSDFSTLPNSQMPSFPAGC